MKRPFAIIGFSYFLTLAFLNFLPSWFVSIVLAILLLLSLIFKKRYSQKVLPAAFFSAFVASVIFNVNYHFKIKPISKLDGQDVKITGTICDILQKSQNKFNYTIKVKSVNDEPVRPFKIIIQSPSAIDCDIYDDFTGYTHTYIPKNTPAFDSELYYRSKNIYAKAFLYDYQENFVQKPTKLPFYYHILKWRQEVISSSKQIFPPQIASVVNGVLLGEKSEIPQEIKTNFADAGVYHVLATSGMHISILAQFFLWLLKKLRFNNKLAPAISAIMVFLFMAITCFTPSVMRAGIMSIIYLIGISIFRNADSLNSLGLAVFLICLLSPNSACNIGLWLSFLSTLGIIVLYGPIQNFLSSKFNKNSKVLNYIISSVSVSLAVEVFTLPIIAWSFRKVSAIFLISNLTTLYLVPFIMIFGLIANLFNLFAFPIFLSTPFVFISALSTGILIKLAEIFAKLPLAVIWLNYSAVSFWLMCTAVLFACAVFTKNRNKNFKIAGLASVNLALIGIISYQVINRGNLLVQIIPCGQGAGLMLAKNGRKAGIICLNENTYTDSLNGHFSSSSIENIDYLNFPVVSSLESINARDIIKNYKPSLVALQIDNFKNLNLKNNDAKFICFESNLRSFLWDEILIESHVVNGYTYIRISSPETIILMFPAGGDVLALPDSWKCCDFMVCHAVPMNYQNIDCKHVVLSMNQNDAQINILKFINSGKPVLSAAHQGPVYLNINSKESYKIRRSQ